MSWRSPHEPETRARQDALVIERCKEHTGSKLFDGFINDHRAAKIMGLTPTLMPTSYELLVMDINEFERCQQRLVRGEYDDAPVIVEPEPEPEAPVYPTEIEFLAMTVEEINDWLERPSCDESEVGTPELEAAVDMAQCIRRLRVKGLLP